MKQTFLVLLIYSIGLGLSQAQPSAQKTLKEWNSSETQQAQQAAAALHEQACSISPYASEKPWHITNLYNCATQELYIPYQLWTGADWNGDKNANCMHAANSRSMLESPGDYYAKGAVMITGPLKWQDDITGKMINVWQRSRSTNNSQKYYVCHSRGIGGIHNVNKPWVQWARGLCNIPAGSGWQIGKKRTCIKTTIEVIDYELDQDNQLKNLTVKFWFRDKLRYRYVYERNYGTKQIFNYQKAITP